MPHKERQYEKSKFVSEIVTDAIDNIVSKIQDNLDLIRSDIVPISGAENTVTITLRINGKRVTAFSKDFEI